MKTDIPLKRLTRLCGDDILPLVGTLDATLLDVRSLELLTVAKRLDNLLVVQSPMGQVYKRVLEWQGYPDNLVLWRLAGYVVWVGEDDPTVPVIGTVIYLAPEDDRGDTLTQVIDGCKVQTWQLHAVRLWEHDAYDAVATGKVGLAVLSPLMHHANDDVVEQAVKVVLQDGDPAKQSEL